MAYTYNGNDRLVGQHQRLSGDLTGVGHSVQLRATASMSNGTSQDVTSTASWASDATGVARVSTSGVVTSVSAGDATITATENGASDDSGSPCVLPHEPPGTSGRLSRMFRALEARRD